MTPIFGLTSYNFPMYGSTMLFNKGNYRIPLPFTCTPKSYILSDIEQITPISERNFDSNKYFSFNYYNNNNFETTDYSPERKPSARKRFNYRQSSGYSGRSNSELKQIYGNYTKDATELYEGTAEDLNRYLRGKGKLAGKGQAFIDAQNKYGISAAVLAGICVNESGHGKSNLARTKNNVGGVRIRGSYEFRTFASVEDCIDYMGSFLKNGYLNKGLTQLYQINAKYCPASDPTDRTGQNSRWARAVNQFSNEIEAQVA